MAQVSIGSKGKYSFKLIFPLLLNMQFLQKYSLFEKMTIVIVNTANTPQAPTIYVFHIIKKHTTIYNNIRRGYLSLIIRKIYDVRYPCPDLLYKIIFIGRVSFLKLCQ